ncbi:MAG: GDP-mannose 4,6-dehydratase [Candidatus Hydrogenedentales bacterium]
MPRALVTGANGFVGKWLCRHLRDSGWEVLETDRAFEVDGDTRRAVDICDAGSVRELADWAWPVDAVFHLAASTFVPDSHADPIPVWRVNVEGTAHLLGAFRRGETPPRFINVSSAEVYGPPHNLPITEDHPLEPANPYAVSKAAADHFARYAFETLGQPVIRARPFNHSGPGQSDQFVLSNFAKQLAQIEAGRQEPILRVGNLQAARDFTHVADVVRAYRLLAERGRPGEAYNICSGRAITIQKALDTLIAESGLAVRIETDPARMRAVDVVEAYGSHAKLTASTGWQPEKNFEDLARDLITFWRENVPVGP